MAEKLNWILHIFKREDKEFEEATRGQAGTIFSSTKGLNNMGSFKMFTGPGIITQCTTRKK